MELLRYQGFPVLGHGVGRKEQDARAHWFSRSRLNFAENLLRRRDHTTAIVSWNESGRLSYHDLNDIVERFPGVWAHWDYAELTDHDGIV